jgi:hypothetical protein
MWMLKRPAKAVNEIIASYAGSAKEDFQADSFKKNKFFALISKQPNIFSIVQSFVRELDVPIEDDQPRIYVYSVKNGVSGELATLLNSIFSETSADKTKKEAAEEPEQPGLRDQNHTGTFSKTDLKD